jgi:hypothetical protein
MKGIWNQEPPRPEFVGSCLTFAKILASRATLCERVPDELYSSEESLGPVEDAPEKFVTHVTVEKDDE